MQYGFGDIKDGVFVFESGILCSFTSCVYGNQYKLQRHWVCVPGWFQLEMFMYFLFKVSKGKNHGNSLDNVISFYSDVDKRLEARKGNCDLNMCSCCINRVGCSRWHVCLRGEATFNRCCTILSFAWMVNFTLDMCRDLHSLISPDSQHTKNCTGYL